MDEPAAKKKPSDSGEEAEPQDDGQQQINTSPQPSSRYQTKITQLSQSNDGIQSSFGLQSDIKKQRITQKYLTKKSLEKAYAIAREKTVIYTFEEDHDDLPDQKKSQATSPESEDLDDDDSELDDFDGPDQELEIPGEPILCRSSAKSQDYWPARVISYTRLKLDKSTIRGGKLSKKSTRKKSEKTYQMQFCDRSVLVTPGSPFWTTDQEEFYTVKRRKKEKLIAESNLESSTSNNQIDQDKDQANPSVPENNTITTEKILEEAKKLATLDIHEVDLVDKVHSLRASQKSHLCI
ncbi:hypothetical protein H4Q26_013682 [Puccinia striiformis f. sp. tritici PST-130]|nr:hypothetical protein H4Q26_013682 [Puccinia striiformis f. sp. tritici PST-130]